MRRLTVVILSMVHLLYLSERQGLDVESIVMVSNTLAVLVRTWPEQKLVYLEREGAFFHTNPYCSPVIRNTSSCTHTRASFTVADERGER